MATSRPSRAPHQSKLDKFTRPKEVEGEKRDSISERKTEVTENATPQPSLAEIMAAIQGVQGALEAKIDTMAVDVNLLRTDLRNIREKVVGSEVAITDLQKENIELKTRVRALEKTSKEHSVKLEDLEGRSRRNNIRVTGVPERAEGSAPELFVEKLVQEGLCPHGLSANFIVERAHRVPGGRPRPGAPPRTIIARIHNYRDRDVILQEARVAPQVKCDNAIIRFFPDFTFQVQQQRRNFLEVKKRLREDGYKYAMMFPAKLRVEGGGRVLFFFKPEAVWDWLDEQKSNKSSEPRKHSPPKTSKDEQKRAETRQNTASPQRDDHLDLNTGTNTIEAT